MFKLAGRKSGFIPIHGRGNARRTGSRKMQAHLAGQTNPGVKVATMRSGRRISWSYIQACALRTSSVPPAAGGSVPRSHRTSAAYKPKTGSTAGHAASRW